MKDLLKNYPVVIEIPIAWGDMDAFQHVNNIMYFKYFESARIAYFEKLKFHEQMVKSGIGPINYHENIKSPIPDEIRARITDLEKNVNQDFQGG